MSPTASSAPPSTADRIALQIDKLCFGYPQRPLFDNLSLTIGAGVTLLRGDDGSGKTTLLRLLSGDLQADSGGLSIHGVALHDQRTRYQSQVFWIDVRTLSGIGTAIIPESDWAWSLLHAAIDQCS